MRVLLLNQTFYPDVVSSAQHLTELALELAQRGHHVTVIAARRAYDQPNRKFPPTQSWRGIRILRLNSTGFGKSSKTGRLLDIATFLALCLLRLLFLPRPDLVIALTSPPLISVPAALCAWLRRSRFLYWVMDFNPGEAIAAGWLRPGSLTARLLHALSQFSLHRADTVIALDRFMQQRIRNLGVNPAKIAVLPPWSHDADVRFDAAARHNFRRAHGLDAKCVVMYSGNHSPCHPLATLLQAARHLAHRSDIQFCFIGGGSQFPGPQQSPGPRQSSAAAPTQHNSASRYQPTTAAAPARHHSPGPRQSSAAALTSQNSAGPHQPALAAPGPRQSPAAAPSPESAKIDPQTPPSPFLCLPYQPLQSLAGSLSAADLHVIVMGDPFVGLVHPCKLYNILKVGAPVLYIGPRPSHITETLENTRHPWAWAPHGDVQTVVDHIQKFADQFAAGQPLRHPITDASFSRDRILPQLVALIEKLERPLMRKENQIQQEQAHTYANNPKRHGKNRRLFVSK